LAELIEIIDDEGVKNLGQILDELVF